MILEESLEVAMVRAGITSGKAFTFELQGPEPCLAEEGD